MKKMMAWLLVFMMIGCASAEMETPENTIPLIPNEKIEIDLDGDGEAEKLTLRMDGVEYESCLRLIIEGSDGAANVYDTMIEYPMSCFCMDMDGDGKQEILLSGDIASDDYFTYCLNYDLETGIHAFSFADASRGANTDEYQSEGYGRIVALNGNTITLRGSQDVLGTWMADRTFTLENGVFELNDGGKWIIPFDAEAEFEWDYGCLNPIKEVPVTFSDGSTGTLAAGEKFVITGTDKVSFAEFITQDGRTGSILIAENTQEGWGYEINGEADYTYFEYIPYAD